MIQIRSMAAWLLAIVLYASMPAGAHGQLLSEPPLVPHDAGAGLAKLKKEKKPKRGGAEWLWQYSPPPAEGREHELIQDTHFLPFLDENLKAPQSFWGPQLSGKGAGRQKTLAETAYDFLTVPGKVVADENRYITATGAVFRLRTSRGLLFVDLNEAQPFVTFAAIDWIRDSKTTDDPNAEYTLWIFPNRVLGLPTQPDYLPKALARSLTRWMAEPLAGSGIVEKVTAAIVVDPDGTPHQIPVPGGGAKPAAADDGPALPRRR